MTLGAILALIAIVLGIIVGVTEEKILFDPLTWFVLAIALNTLETPIVFKGKGASA